MGKIIKILLVVILYCSLTPLHAQFSIRDFVLFGKEGVQMSSSSSIIDGGKVGSNTLIKTSGTATLNSGLHSKGIIQLANSNTIKGNISAANFGNLTGTGVQIGSNTNIEGTIDANGNITITSGVVQGPIVSSGTYTGPKPTGSVTQNGTPTLPVLPDLPQLLIPVQYNTNNPAVVNTSTISPGSYVSMGLTGSKTVTFNGTGDYVFGSILNSGNFNKFIFDFKGNNTGIFRIFVTGNVDLNRILIEQVNLPLPATPTNLDIAARVLMQVNGTGGTNGYAWSITNGASGNNQSNFYGTVIAPNGSINVGSGSSLSKIVGGLWSGKTINIQSGVSITYSALICSQAIADAGENKTFTCPETQTSIGTNNSNGTNYKWTTIIDGVETIVGNQKIISVNKPGTYTLHVSNICGVTVSDEVIVSYVSCVEPINETPVGSVDNLIGHVLTYLNDENKLEEAKKHIIILGSSYDSVLIEAVAIDGLEHDAYDTLYKYGLRDTTKGLNPLIIIGSFPIANLLLLTEPGPSTVINEVRPVYLPFGNVGTITSRGDTSVGAHLVKSGFNVFGDSVKIGVISDSYNTLNKADIDVSNGDLPGVDNPDENLTPVHIVKEFPWGIRSDEGRAMLQIIHDLAPKAHLAFRTGFLSAGDFANGILQLKDAGCKIIVDDVTYITEPFFKDGIVSQAVSIVKDHGVSYFTSAGNFGSKSYSTNFNPTTAAGSTLVAHNFGGGDIHQRLKLKSGSYTIVLQWQDEFYSLGGNAGAKNDFDIYLIDPSGSIGFNKNNLGADPVEVLSFSINLADTSQVIEADLMIVKAGSVSGALTNPLIKYIIFRGNATIEEYYSNLPLVNKSTIVGHANSEHAIAVGAVLWSNTPAYGVVPTIASFSSTGGTPIFNGTGSIVRAKPELTGPNGVNTSREVSMGPDNEGDGTSDGYPNFYGTSASAPHAAAVAALVLDARKKYYNQSLTPDALKYILFNTAIPMQPDGVIGGVNFKAGYGLVQANMAIRSFANPTPFINQLLYSSEITPGTTPFTLTVKGEHLSPDAVIYFRGEPIATVVNSSLTELTGEIPIFTGNPPVNVLNPSFKGATNDGGLSNSLYFFTAVRDTVRIIVDNKVKKYGEALPELTATILLNNDTLEVYNQNNGTNITPADLGVENLIFRYSNSAINALTDVGNYQIRVSRPFDATNEDDIALLEKYHYDSTFGNLQITKLAVTVVPADTSIVYGEALTNFEFNYIIDPSANLAEPNTVIDIIRNAHQEHMSDNVLGLLNNDAGNIVIYNGKIMSVFTNASIIINGKVYPVITLSNGGAGVIFNGEEYPIVTLSNGGAGVIFNGEEQPVVNGGAGVIFNGQLYAVNTNSDGTSDITVNKLLLKIITLTNGGAGVIFNGEEVPITTLSNGGAGVIFNGLEIEILNTLNDLATLNTFSLDVVTLVNGGAGVIFNGQEIPVVNLSNGGAGVIFNGEYYAVVSFSNGGAGVIFNGQEIPVVNLSNGGAGVIFNGEEIKISNGGAGVIFNGESLEEVLFTNGGAGVIFNGEELQIYNGGAGVIFNGDIYQIINGGAGVIFNGEFLQIVTLSNGGAGVIFNGVEYSITYVNGGAGVIFNGGAGVIFNTEEYPIFNRGAGVIFNGQFLSIETLSNGGAGVIFNGVEQPVINGGAGVIFNGQEIPVVNLSNGGAGVIFNGVEYPLVTLSNGGAGVIFNGVETTVVNALSSDMLSNYNTMATLNAVANARANSIQSTNYVDVSINALLNLHFGDPSQAALVNTLPTVNARGMLELNAIVNGGAGVIFNGEDYSIINGSDAIANNNTVSGTSNIKTAVIVDAADVNSTDGSGASIQMTGINMISGFTAGEQILIPATLLNPNLDISYKAGNVTIVKAPITIKSNNVKKLYGEDLKLDPTGFTITSGEMKYGERVSVVDQFSNGTNPSSPIGNYPIIPSNAVGFYGTDLENYSISYVNGILSVECGGPESQCTVPTSYTNDVVLSGNKKWSDVLPRVSPDNITGTIRIRGSGTLTVSNKNLLLKNNKAVLVIEGITLIVDNGNFGLDNSYSRVIIKDASVRVSGNFYQNTFTQLCISNSEIEVGDELSNGIFSLSGSSTSGSFQNNGGYRYLSNVCLNITKNLELSSSGNGTVSGGGLDIFVNVKGEIGDQGSNNACTGFDSNDNGSWISNKRQEIYCSEFHVTDNVINSSSSTMIVKGADFRTLRGNFENSATISGSGLNLAINNQILNSGTWSAGVGMWYASGTSGNLSLGPKASSLQAVLDAKFDCGCNLTNSTEFITSASRSNTTAIVNETKQPGMHIFPNPASNFIIISFIPATTGNSIISLFSIDGRMISEIYNGVSEKGINYNKKIETNRIATGTYFIEFKQNDYRVIKKLIINKQ